MVPAGKQKSGAFTLIELLVVVAIIALLLAILTPSLYRVRELTRRVMCGSNLHQYGVAIQSYRADNRLQIMRIVHQWGNRPYPDYIRFDSLANPAWIGEWGIRQINQYITSFDMTLESVGGISMCPSVDTKLMNRFITERNFQALRQYQFLEYQYVYWGRADLLNDAFARNGAKNDLAGRLPKPNQLILSDILYFDWSDWVNPNLGAWRYNHGPNGWAFNEASYLPQDFGTSPNFSGINRLFCDGSVPWKSRDEFDYVDLMHDPLAYPDGFIGQDSQDSFYY